MGKKKKKNKADKVREVSVQDIASRIRAFILDSQIENPHELAVILGCSHISEEVAEMEEDASDERIERIEYLSPFILFFAKTLAEGLVESQRTEVPPEEVPNDVWINTKRLIEHTATSALLGTITQMVDLGLLKIPKGKR